MGGLEASNGFGAYLNPSFYGKSRHWKFCERLSYLRGSVEGAGLALINGCRFDSRPACFRVQPWASFHTNISLLPGSINLVVAQAGR